MIDSSIESHFSIYQSGLVLFYCFGYIFIASLCYNTDKFQKGADTMKNMTVKRTAFIGLMAALVFVTSKFLQIPIPTAIDNTRLHMGNVMCLLSGLLLGGIPGGLAAGIGSVIFDLLDPQYITSAPFTFLFKFCMAWICGLIAHHGGQFRKGRAAIGAITGALSYVVLYLLKTYIENKILGYELETILITLSQKGITSLANAVIAAAISIPLAISLRPALKRFQLLP